MSLLSLTCYATEVEHGDDKNEEIRKLLAMDLEQLLEVTIETASGIEQTLRNAPAAMVVITDEDIRRRSYTNLTEIFADLPGFDTMQTGSSQHVTAYQRGYRTPFMQRMLLMINGIVDNHLWSHGAQISRQYPIGGLKQIEVLYGPTSAVYGPNAFLGIINLITEDGGSLKNGETRVNISTQLGSYQSRGAEAHIQGKHGDWRFNLSAKTFHSNEAGLDELAPWGFLTTEQLNNKNTWGAILDLGNEGVKYGEYSDPTKDWGVLGEVHFRDFALGVIAWDTREGYGPYYAGDRVQPNVYWKHDAQQIYLKHDSQANDKLTVKSQVSYHANRIWGNWVEAVPDWNENKSAYSYVSISDWNSLNYSGLFKQDYDYQFSKELRFTGGLKYEAKTLTKAYDLCSYWNGTFCSSESGDTGRYGQGSGVFHSTDSTVVIAPSTLDSMPEENLVRTRDVGMYLQALWTQNKWNWLAGVRYDRNSMYGSSINPRVSSIYHFSPETTFKLSYGKAFQEPSPIQLWGGWSGRTGNPDLKPEQAENLELIIMHQQEHWLHDLSLFTAYYKDVVKEEAENAGTRNIRGLEYRGRFNYPNPLFKNAPNLTGNLYYTYTESSSSITYDQTARSWLNQTSELGDIAPHKINLGIDIPFDQDWYINWRTNYVSERVLYSHNPLREQGKTAKSFTVSNLSLGYRQEIFDLNFTVKNIFDKEYYFPGGEQADSGDDFSQRSLGFRNSLIPAEKRSFWLNFRATLN
ncbi:TonB-dependent receptor plug domain-containing protein [Thioflexithrix psekupsensis]|nr:TonB-dependent receptor [Thioflexithrix psekupsensis]